MKKIIVILLLFPIMGICQTYIGSGLSVGFGQEQFLQHGKQINKTTAQVFSFNMYGGYQKRNLLIEASGLYDGSFRGSGNIGYKFGLGGRNSFELLPGGSIVTYFGQSPVKLTGTVTGRLMFGHFGIVGSYYTDRVFYVGVSVRAFTFE